MHLIHKIKSYYIRHGFYLWQDFDPSQMALSFSEPDDDVLMDIGAFIQSRIKPAAALGNERHRLLPGAASKIASIDEVLVLLKFIINADLAETKMESGLYNWDFRYRCDFHPKCADTITVSTVLKSNDKKGYCVYNLASVRLFDGGYYCWNYLK